VPVVDADRRMRGIVTVDDVVDVVQEAATEDIHRLGGLAALEMPYLAAGLVEVIRKRAGWLALLFVGELGTASAMAHYEGRISELVILAVFVPLVISSGGNSGSQAATLITRALALGEVRPGDVLRVVRREVAVGLILGALLGTLGFLRVGAWELLFGTYGPAWAMLGIALSMSLLCVVLWGTLAGAVLPLLIRRVGLDPASASAPLVATLVDVSGLVIYFSLAGWLLGL
jgi:magnesium transporter